MRVLGENKLMANWNCSLSVLMSLLSFAMPWVCWKTYDLQVVPE